MILVLATTILMLVDPTPDQDIAPPMESDIARSRISQAISVDTDEADRVSILNEIIDRCDDSYLVSLAGFNLGTTLMDSSTATSNQALLAIEAFQIADRNATDSVVRSRARFNLGHMLYLVAHAEDESESLENMVDIQSMIDSMLSKIEKLKVSAGAFRSVIQIDANAIEAAKNVERVRLEIKALQDQVDALNKMLEEQQEQQRQQQQQQQDAADKLEDLAQEQQQQAENTESSPPENEQKRKEQSEEQQELSNETNDAKDEVAKQPETDQVQQKIQEAQEAQKRAQEAMSNGNQELAAQEQEAAAKALQEAAEQMQEIADESKGQGDSEGEPDSESEGEQGDQEGQPESESEDQQGDEISEIAKQLLDKERREREARQAYRATGRPTKVEKDW